MALRTTATWIDPTPLGGTNWYKLTAYRNSWYSPETAESQGAVPVPFVLSGTLTGTSLAASWTAAPGATSYDLTRVSNVGLAKFSGPKDVAFGPDGILYVVDGANNRIRKVTMAGVVTTLAGSGAFGSADGAGAVASFNFPWGIAVGADGIVYVADSGNHRIR